MQTIEILLLIISVMIMAVVLLQQRSSGLGGAFGGDDAVFTSRRGAERSLYRFTILLGVIYVALGLYLVYVQRPAKPVAVDANTVTTDTAATPAATDPTTNQ